MLSSPMVSAGSWSSRYCSSKCCSSHICSPGVGVSASSRATEAGGVPSAGSCGVLSGISAFAVSTFSSKVTVELRVIPFRCGIQILYMLVPSNPTRIPSSARAPSLSLCVLRSFCMYTYALHPSTRMWLMEGLFLSLMLPRSWFSVSRGVRL